MTTLKNTYNLYSKTVTDKLREYITGAPGVLQASMEYSLFGEGKRLRPVLLLAALDAYSCPATEEAYKIAAAIECIHTYSLIHDDLPAMDNDEIRRGQPTNHIKFGEATALLAGDALLNFAGELLLSAAAYNRKYANAALLVSKHAGVQGMIGGQAIEFEGDIKNAGDELLLEVYEKKTCKLISSGLLAAAVIAGCSDDDYKNWVEFGKQFGLCFQLKDDLLDEEKQDDYGTLLHIWGRERTTRELNLRTASAMNCLKKISADTGFISEFAQSILIRNTEGM